MKLVIASVMEGEMMNKKIIVVGAGAIGCLLAAMLSKQYSVVVVGRRQHVEVIKKRGLKITGLVDQVLQLEATTTVPKIEAGTIIFLTTKAQDSALATEMLSKQLKKDTVIVCMQNGLGSDEVVRSLVNCRVVRAVTYLSAEMVAPGTIRYAGDSPSYFGKDDKDIASIFNKVGLKTKVMNEINGEIWKKLVFNCVINGLGTVLGVPNNELADPSLDEVKKALVAECVRVADKEGIKLGNNLLDQINEFIKTSTNVNSTLQDIRKNKTTEMEFLNGAIVRLGKKHGIATPINQMIYDLLSYPTKSMIY